MKTSVFSSLLAIAQANPAGFTVSFDQLAPIAHGYAVAVAATQNSFGEAGLRRRLMDHLQKANKKRW